MSDVNSCHTVGFDSPYVCGWGSRGDPRSSPYVSALLSVPIEVNFRPLWELSGLSHWEAYVVQLEIRSLRTDGILAQSSDGQAAFISGFVIVQNTQYWITFEKEAVWKAVAELLWLK